MKTAISSLALTSALLLGGFCACAKDSSALELARQLNDAFIEVADKVSPTVVVIIVDQKELPDNGDSSFWEMLPPEWRKRFEEFRDKEKDNKDKGNHNRKPRRQRDQAQGSGIVITEDGYILTNNHVVENAEKISVRFQDGRKFDAEVKGTDPESDIAIIKIKAKGLTAAVLGDSDKTRVGEFALAIGAPFELSYSVTVGHISAKGRSFHMADEPYADQDFIQTDARINPGNSGGPLVNLYGEVIGINSMIRGLDTGIGFAIPINLAKRVEDHLIHEGKFVRSYLGIGIGNLEDADEFKKLDPSLIPNVEEGVLITEILPDGPAAKSDLKPADVVVAVDGIPVKASRQLQWEISSKPVGKTVALDIVRTGNKHLTIKIKTEALPSGDIVREEQKPDNETPPSTCGLTVQPITKDLAEKFGVEMATGVMVTDVEQDSSADEQGIQPGDIVTDINHKSIASPAQFREAIEDANPKKGILVNLISKGTSRFVVLHNGD